MSSPSGASGRRIQEPRPPRADSDRRGSMRPPMRACSQGVNPRPGSGRNDAADPVGLGLVGHFSAAQQPRGGDFPVDDPDPRPVGGEQLDATG